MNASKDCIKLGRYKTRSGLDAMVLYKAELPRYRPCFIGYYKTETGAPVACQWEANGKVASEDTTRPLDLIECVQTTERPDCKGDIVYGSGCGVCDRCRGDVGRLARHHRQQMARHNNYAKLTDDGIRLCLDALTLGADLETAFRRMLAERKAFRKLPEDEQAQAPL